ncbi:MAG: formate dehydrogenase subunit gamma [Gammaproteobacteria bacterium]
MSSGEKDRRYGQGAARSRLALWSVSILLILSAVLPLGAYLYSSVASAQQATSRDVNPRANYWRAVRDGDRGDTTSSGPYTTNVLIQNGGQNFRVLRNGPLVSYGAGLMALMLAAIIVFFAVRGRIRIEGGRSGERVPRFTLTDRILHWSVVVLFLLLAITGLILMYGRAVLIPIFGLPFFAATAAAAKFAHNLFGPLFVVALVIMIVKFIAGNLPARGDLKWLLRGGGMLRGRHASAGRYNTGEKFWFWVVTLMGLTVAVTGLILDFPVFGQTRGIMQLSQLLHGAAALIFITGALGHIYIGTLGMEGALEAMTRGSVDGNWAREHHDQWYEKMKAEGRLQSEAAEQARSGTGPAPLSPAAGDNS